MREQTQDGNGDESGDGNEGSRGDGDGDGNEDWSRDGDWSRNGDEIGDGNGVASSFGRKTRCLPDDLVPRRKEGTRDGRRETMKGIRTGAGTGAVRVRE